MCRSESSEAFPAETRDISSDGFFCYADEPFGIGEILHCLIMLPDPAGSESGSGVCIEGTAEVVHIVADGSPSSFGLGCRIREFKIVSAAVRMASLGVARNRHGYQPAARLVNSNS
jgi:hypothetical protein